MIILSMGEKSNVGAIDARYASRIAASLDEARRMIEKRNKIESRLARPGEKKMEMSEPTWPPSTS